MKKHLLFLLLTLFILNESNAQNEIMLIRNSRSEKFIAKSLDGKLLFELPPNHIPGVRQKFQPFYLDDFYLYDFSSGLLGVKYPDGYYFLNKKGEKILESTKSVRFISEPSQGFVRVFEQIGDSRSSMIKYFSADNKLKQLNNTAYWEGTRFEAGYAIVQLEDENGDWLVIDTKGKTVKNLSQEFGCEISRYGMSHKNSMWTLKTKKGCDKKGSAIYFNDNGICSMDYKEVKIKSQKIFNEDHFNPRSLSELGHLKIGDNSYSLLEKNDQSIEITAQVNGKEKSKKISSKLLSSNHKIFMESYMNAYIILCILTMDKKEKMIVIDAKNLKVVSKFDEVALYGQNGIFMFGPGNRWGLKAERVATVSGKYIYGLEDATRMYRDIELASKKPSKVQLIELTNITGDQLKNISKFKNLRSLTIVKSDLDAIPKDLFSKLKNLEIIHFNELPNLQELSLDVTALSNLKRVEIMNCPKVTNLSQFLDKLPSLSSLRTDLDTTKGQRDQLKLKFPNLDIEEVLVMDMGF